MALGWKHQEKLDRCRHIPKLHLRIKHLSFISQLIQKHSEKWKSKINSGGSAFHRVAKWDVPLGFIIHDHSDHGISKETPNTNFPEGIQRFLWCTMIRVTLIMNHDPDHPKWTRPKSDVLSLQWLQQLTVVLATLFLQSIRLPLLALTFSRLKITGL